MKQSLPDQYENFINGHLVKETASSALSLILTSALIYGFHTVGMMLYGTFVLLKPPGSYLNGSQDTYVLIHKIN